MTNLKALKCEICGGSLSKQNDKFVCDYCGTKYTSEEAKKLLVKVDGDVNVRGNIGVARTATVAVGRGDLRYCTNCKTNINAESSKKGVTELIIGMIFLFFSVPIWFITGILFDASSLVLLLMLLIGLGIMSYGAYINSINRYVCPYCGTLGSGKNGSDISPPRLNN